MLLASLRQSHNIGPCELYYSLGEGSERERALLLQCYCCYIAANLATFSLSVGRRDVFPIGRGRRRDVFSLGRGSNKKFADLGTNEAVNWN